MVDRKVARCLAEPEHFSSDDAARTVIDRGLDTKDRCPGEAAWVSLLR
jgi:hypothetical protein